MFRLINNNGDRLFRVGTDILIVKCLTIRFKYLFSCQGTEVVFTTELEAQKFADEFNRSLLEESIRLDTTVLSWYPYPILNTIKDIGSDYARRKSSIKAASSIKVPLHGYTIPLSLAALTISIDPMSQLLIPERLESNEQLLERLQLKRLKPKEKIKSQPQKAIRADSVAETKRLKPKEEIKFQPQRAIRADSVAETEQKTDSIIAKAIESSRDLTGASIVESMQYSPPVKSGKYRLLPSHPRIRPSKTSLRD